MRILLVSFLAASCAGKPSEEYLVGKNGALSDNTNAVHGGLGKGAIDDSIKLHMPEIRDCYTRALDGGATFEGKIETVFEIGSNGNITKGGILQTTLHNEKVEKCVVNVLKRTHFPAPAGGGTVRVEYPFIFTPTPK